MAHTANAPDGALQFFMVQLPDRPRAANHDWQAVVAWVRLKVERAAQSKYGSPRPFPCLMKQALPEQQEGGAPKPASHSQPLSLPGAAGLAQSRKPALHTGVHKLAEQVGGPEALMVVHARPQEPQLFGSLAVLTSQPSRRLFALQSAKPLTQLPLQKPPVQVRLAIPVAEQA